MLVYIKPIGWVFIGLGAFCVVAFVLWLVIEGAVGDAIRKNRER